ncbi:flagellar basal body L-ring protein, partial [marine sediment metagenome]
MRILGLSAALFLLGGCASTNEPPVKANDPSFAPVVPDYPRETVVEDGSLFRSRLANNLYSDVTARRVGDIITVTLSENTQASKSADTSTAKDSNVNLNPIT